MEKTKKLAVIIVFALIIFGFGIAHVIIPDAELSKAERRKLSKPPELQTETVFSGKYSKDLESYLLDQFPMRETFRRMKAAVNNDILMVSDNKGLYRIGDGLYKLEYPLNVAQVSLAAKKIESIIAAHPEMGEVYYSVIPDKNYFVAAENSYPSIDYEAMLKTLGEGIQNAEYIDIFDCLTIDDYYRTDTHWKQASLFPVVERLCDKMGVPYAPESDYERQSVSPFYGVLSAQSAISVPADEIVYLTSSATENARVTSAELTEPIEVYTLEKLDGMDAYDIFLYGAQAVISIENPNAQTDKELVLFRDSFGSSLAPLLIDSYAKITMVDLRYLSSEILSDYVSFENADVLFLYSTMLINTAGILR